MICICINTSRICRPRAFFKYASKSMSDERHQNGNNANENANVDNIAAEHQIASKKAHCVFGFGALAAVLLTGFVVSLFYWAGRHALLHTPDVEIVGCVVCFCAFSFVGIERNFVKSTCLYVVVLLLEFFASAETGSFARGAPFFNSLRLLSISIVV